MEVILTENLRHKGKAGDVVRVKLGYARNFLFVKGLAIPKTKANLDKIATIKKINEEKLSKEKANFEAIARVINGKEFVFEVKIHDEGKLYGSVSKADVVDKIKQKYDVNIDKKYLLMTDHFKDTGFYKVKLDFHPDIECSIVVKIKGIGDADPVEEKIDIAEDLIADDVDLAKKETKETQEKSQEKSSVEK